VKKNKETELDVYYIGGEVPLTLAEEEAISSFIIERKHIKSKRTSVITRITKLHKVKA
jgi:hypothetical protein